MRKYWKLKKPVAVVTSIALAFSLAVAPGVASAGDAQDELATGATAMGDVPEWAVDDGADAQSGKLEAESALPSKYDLRSDGLVTPVKSQSPWRACWAFAGIAAAETSMLSATGFTAEENPTDLSERHLAYFALNPVTEVDDSVQAGEGMYTMSHDRNAAFDAGGMPAYITTLFSQGVGPQAEAMFPYRGVDAQGTSRLGNQAFESDPEGTTLLLYASTEGMTADEYKEKLEKEAETQGTTYEEVLKPKMEEAKKYCEGDSTYFYLDDWTIPATDGSGNSNRTLTPFMTLRDGNVLPQYQNAGNTPNPQSIAAMKQELVNGHGVTISYKADKASPGESGDSRYINRDTWAQYTFEPTYATHAVCIVGYNDDYLASNFTHNLYVLDDKGKPIIVDGEPLIDPDSDKKTTPPGNGAWIVKNSWGSETDKTTDDLGNVINNGTYGVPDENGNATGYFYLSYFDKTISQPETMTFSPDLLDEANDFEVLQHDYMAAQSGFYTTPATAGVTSSANVFETSQDLSIKAVSTRTSEENQRVTFAIYELKDGATEPTDGTMLYRTSRNFEYAGFHRLDLDWALGVKAGKKIAVVSTASTLDSDGTRLYSASANQAFSKQSVEFLNGMGVQQTVYGEAVVNEGESFLFSNGQWVDWSEHIAALPKSTEEFAPGFPFPGDTYIDQFPIDNFSIKLYTTAAEAQDASVAYHSHVQSYGWEQQWYHDGDQSGTTGQSKRLEAIEMKLENAPFDGSIEYRSHVQGIGWEQSWAADGATSGTSGQSKRLEALQVRLTGDMADRYSVWYRVHSQTFGWLGWACNGQAAGTAGQSKRLEAVEVQVLPDGQVPADYVEGQASYIGAVTGDAHVQGIGWTGNGSALEFGTTGQSKRLEAISLSIPNQPEAGGISYEVHAQGIGWMGEVADGALAGTTGQSRRLEAVRISLTGDMNADYSVWYRVHSQTYGWLGWAKDGDPAGTAGLSKRAEAIDVQILPVGQFPDGYDAAQAACVTN